MRTRARVCGGNRFGSIFGTLLAMTLAAGLAAPALAAEPGMSDAEKLRRLDIMLMVTSLRCRTTADNFQADYGRFTAKHIKELNKASRDLQAELSAGAGERDAARALDRMSVVMANQYGGGHPWLDCSELRQAAQSLAVLEEHGQLVEAAGQLLEGQRHPAFALAGR